MARGKRAAATPKPEPKKRTYFRVEPNAADAASAAYKKIKKLEARKLAAETALAKKQEEIEELETEDPVRRFDLSKPLHGVFHGAPFRNA